MPGLSRRKIAVVFDGGLASFHGQNPKAVQRMRQMVDDVRSGLSSLAWDVEEMQLCSEPGALFAAAAELRKYDTLFNLTEYLGGTAEGEERATSLLELVGRPFTGNSSRALSLCRSKIVTRALLAEAGVPVPPGRAIRSPDASLAGLSWPSIIKPSDEDSSRGIEHDSVAENERQARGLIDRLFCRGFGPCLVESFVGGREFGVGLVEEAPGVVRTLPILEVHYQSRAQGNRNFLCYSTKWDEGHALHATSQMTAAAPIADATRARLEAIALDVWRVCGLRGYARVDLRLDDAKQPFVIDVNPNPDIGTDGGLAECAARAGIPYPELLGHIVNASRV
jgi:D-alanine-D-alanine ligase